MGRIKRKKVCLICQKEYSSSNISRHYKTIHQCEICGIAPLTQETIVVYAFMYFKQLEFKADRIATEIRTVISNLNENYITIEDFNQFYDYATILHDCGVGDEILKSIVFKKLADGT